MQENFEVPVGPVVAAVIAAALGFVGWIIRVAARESMASLKSSVAGLQKSLDGLSGEISHLREDIADVRVDQAGLQARVSAVEERWRDRDDG